eukprot:CAMPEP_0196588498 /NCGR_PEP_ID=MMETSP1081-20130531/60681_1 /TAXON_ID=36882 /ORGANISM="Pyramimonas amylifera, Strain CCMP720" /LENGTH=253 /DNA_ID=CAMNT_0041911003 /DNA_START=146 /DNA_END=907 /DNA_ORIENTATION=-
MSCPEEKGAEFSPNAMKTVSAGSSPVEQSTKDEVLRLSPNELFSELDRKPTRAPNTSLHSSGESRKGIETQHGEDRRVAKGKGAVTSQSIPQGVNNNNKRDALNLKDSRYGCDRLQKLSGTDYESGSEGGDAGAAKKTKIKNRDLTENAVATTAAQIKSRKKLDALLQNVRKSLQSSAPRMMARLPKRITRDDLVQFLSRKSARRVRNPQEQVLTGAQPADMMPSIGAQLQVQSQTHVDVDAEAPHTPEIQPL